MSGVPARAGIARGMRPGREKRPKGGRRVEVPQIRGREEPYRSPLWSQGANTREVLKRVSVELYAGGSPRDMVDGLAKAVGQFGLSKSAIRELTATRSQEYAAFRTRDLSGYAVAYLLLEAV